MRILWVVLAVVTIHATLIMAILPRDETVTPGGVAVAVIFDIVVIGTILIYQGAGYSGE